MEERRLERRPEGGVKLNRREFVYSLSALSVAPPIALLASAGRAIAATAPDLTEAEKRTLGDVCQQLIPADEYPGARESGVVNFIDRLLKEAHPDWIVVYQSGLKSTDLSSEDMHGGKFSELSSSQQIEVLKKMERGELSNQLWFSIPSGEFFSMVLSHTMQSFYGHPKWGGNRNKEAWKMIGYDDFWA